ncbi:uncharacterized protein NFIA_030550 [Aspergillus fischeri NRRL 181]|uniref:Uncharacterized protein n=1 Tax=Neosartorya fischeri (strain ATCC 1020 / DSM 3700 / CBS 544.65 / FGSC A1164 / JCM 1740 / NRRL 181 / WB 181) TaxID=331117 RepID=A1D9Z1_NEOFI|nr:uncharacterized protein NFIA_030550 [Aspergillus fischeri NRRL 181]EAW20622.1 hypothetical protein NFIA_030550 [Aspergillus fischeri NRRL 181]
MPNQAAYLPAALAKGTYNKQEFIHNGCHIDHKIVVLYTPSVPFAPSSVCGFFLISTQPMNHEKTKETPQIPAAK